MISASSEGCSRASRFSLTERLTCEGLTSRIGATESHAIIERGTLPIAREPAPAERAQTEAAQQSGDADVGGDDAQPSARVGNLDVVDAHDLAAVNVDDLLVEQIGNEIEFLALGRRRLFRRHRQRDVAVAIDVGDRLDRREAQTLRRLDDQPVDLRKDRVGLADEKIGNLADRQLVDRRPAADQLRDEPLGERHRLAGIAQAASGARRIHAPPRSFHCVSNARTVHAAIHPSAHAVEAEMQVLDAEPRQRDHERAADECRPVIEKRVSPEARIGASETIAQPLIGSVTMCSASGSAAIDRDGRVEGEDVGERPRGAPRPPRR